MSHSNGHKFPNYVINHNGPKPEPERTQEQKAAIRERRRRLRDIDDKEFEKALGIFGEKY